MLLVRISKISPALGITLSQSTLWKQPGELTICPDVKIMTNFGDNMKFYMKLTHTVFAKTFRCVGPLAYNRFWAEIIRKHIASSCFSNQSIAHDPARTFHVRHIWCPCLIPYWVAIFWEFWSKPQTFSGKMTGVKIITRITTSTTVKKVPFLRIFSTAWRKTRFWE